MKVVMERFEKIILNSKHENAELLLFKDKNDCYLDINIQNQYDWFEKGFDNHHEAIKEKLFTNPEKYI